MVHTSCTYMYMYIILNAHSKAAQLLFLLDVCILCLVSISFMSTLSQEFGVFGGLITPAFSIELC